MSSYVAVLIFAALIIGFAVVSLGWPAAQPGRPGSGEADELRVRRRADRQAWVQFPVGFYLVALVFIVFDALAVFLFPWAWCFAPSG